METIENQNLKSTKQITPALSLISESFSIIHKHPEFILKMSFAMAILSTVNEFLYVYHGEEALTLKLIIILSIAGMIISLVGGIMMILFLENNEEAKDWRALLRKAWSKFGSYFWVMVLTTIILLCGFILFLIPGIILTVYYSLVTYTNIVENKQGYEALKRSLALTRNYWWALTSRTITIGIFSLLIYLPSILINTIIPENLLMNGYALIPIIYNLAAAIIIIPVGIIYSYLIYKDLIKIKEN